MDFEYREKYIKVPITSIIDDVRIIPFGDVHKDSALHNESAWKYFLADQKKKMTSNTFFIGMGDYNDFASESEQEYLNKGTKLHQDTKEMFSLTVEENIRKFCDDISFMKGRILGMLDGNHNWTFSNGETATQNMCNRLNTECFGWICYLHLVFNVSGKLYAVDMVLCHGKAGGKTAGVTFNQVDELRKVFPSASVYVMNHDHSTGAKKEQVLVWNTHKNRIEDLTQHLCRGGCFLLTYKDGSRSYGIRRLYKPSVIGAIEINIKFVYVCENKKKLYQPRISVII